MKLPAILSKVAKAAIALPLVTASLAFNAASAEAGALSGSFQIGSLFTKLNLSKDGLDFSNPYTDPAEVLISGATGDFVGFNSAFIADLIPIDATPTPFLDLSVAIPFPDAQKSADGKYVFNVTQSSGLIVTQEEAGVLGINVELDGVFRVDANDASLGQSKGQSILTFQLAEAGITVTSFERRLASGEIFSDLTFSGAAFTATEDVPEPGAILGLLAVGGIAGTTMCKQKEG
ncbi:MAG: PEP-CTERM sorting domain-containing protein [Cyanobacteria bacterium SBLK]|nr:PEP-CTERM sorting domain-containing protein [Cyanobacteria bacterium SBLK]